MRYVAAYLLAALGGNSAPSAKDIKKILGSVGIEADDEKLNKVIDELKGKEVDEVMAEGKQKKKKKSYGGTVPPTQKLACFALYLKYQNLGWPSGSWVIDPNNILTILIHNLKSVWPTKISMSFLSSLNNLL